MCILSLYQQEVYFGNKKGILVTFKQKNGFGIIRKKFLMLEPFNKPLPIVRRWNRKFWYFFHQWSIYTCISTDYNVKGHYKFKEELFSLLKIQRKTHNMQVQTHYSNSKNYLNELFKYCVKGYDIMQQNPKYTVSTSAAQ